MEWGPKLSPRIFLKDGRRLSTLDDVKSFIEDLPQKAATSPGGDTRKRSFRTLLTTTVQ
jgi:hypothetical protein